MNFFMKHAPGAGSIDLHVNQRYHCTTDAPRMNWNHRSKSLLLWISTQYVSEHRPIRNKKYDWHDRTPQGLLWCSPLLYWNIISAYEKDQGQPLVRFPMWPQIKLSNDIRLRLLFALISRARSIMTARASVRTTCV